ncbi:MAG: hypothetical protein QUV04_02355 [Synechococcus sp. WH 8007]|nr:hypothetical protein [Synechococcus sp. WH 8007]
MLWSLKHSLKTKLQSLADHLERYRYSSLFADLLDKNESGRLVSGWIGERRPCLVARLGSVESRLVGESCYKNSKWSRKTFKEAHRNAGIFPVNSTSLSEVASCLQAGFAQVDLLAQWQSPYQVRLILDHLGDSSLRCDLSSLEPWWIDVPWTSALVGKKVLVVHPFAATICSQYQRREHLFEDRSILPPFDLITLRPPQTLGYGTEAFGSWIEALDHLIAQVSAIDFDVALIGCGAYGLPLGAAIKAMGKPAIHLGGALQLLFGIRGRRWESMPQYAALMTNSWVRPLPEETPLYSNHIDGGCYW